MKICNQLLITAPIKGWQMFHKSPRAVTFVKLLLEMCGDIITYFITAGAVIMLDVMNIMEGKYITHKNRQINHQATTKKKASSWYNTHAFNEN